MTARRLIAAVAVFVATAILTPVAGVAGLVAWEQYAPRSFRTMALDVSALTDPINVDRSLNQLAVMLGEPAGGKGGSG